METLHIFPDIVESVFVSPNYEKKFLKELIYKPVNSSFHGDVNARLDTMIIRKAYVILKPKFSKLNIKLSSMESLPNDRILDFICKNEDDIIYWQTRMTILDPVIVNKRMDQYIESKISVRTILMSLDKPTLAKIKLMI